MGKGADKEDSIDSSYIWQGESKVEREKQRLKKERGKRREKIPGKLRRERD